MQTIKVQNGNCNDNWSEPSGENFRFRDWIPLGVWVEAGPFITSRECFMAGTLLNYGCGSDSSNLSKSSELFPVQVPARVLLLEENKTQTNLPLYSEVALDIILHNTMTCVLSRVWLYDPWSWTGPWDASHGFFSEEGEMNEWLFFLMGWKNKKMNLPYGDTKTKQNPSVLTCQSLLPCISITRLCQFC